MPRHIVTSGCEVEINEIIDHVAADDVHAAVAFYKRLRDVFKLISENPKVGRERQELSEGLRSFPAGSYLIFYRIRVREVAIVRVVHGARDLDQSFDQ